MESTKNKELLEDIENVKTAILVQNRIGSWTRKRIIRVLIKIENYLKDSDIN